MGMIWLVMYVTEFSDQRSPYVAFVAVQGSPIPEVGIRK